jgi:hypothetical protein
MLLFEMHVGKRLLVASLTTKQRTGAAESGAALLPYPSQHATPGKPRPPANMAMRNMRILIVGYSLGANNAILVANNTSYVDSIIALQPSMLTS